MKAPNLTTDNEKQAAWWRRGGLVYFFAAGQPPKAIKIGVTSVEEGRTISESLRSRLSSIQSSNHETIELLGVIRFVAGEFPTRDAEVKERELHVQYAHLQRFKAHTRAAEWFNVSDDLLAEIEASTEKPETLGVPRIIASAMNRSQQISN
jgi:hypothetical protein